jgi:hypothetical protein
VSGGSSPGRDAYQGIMSDFYSVLKESILERGLASFAEREEVYSQARRAMVQRLWSYDPPLAENEIDTRIGLFNDAVDRIESDLVTAFAEQEAMAGMDEPDFPRPTDEARSPPPVYRGYDEDRDDRPAFDNSPESFGDGRVARIISRAVALLPENATPARRQEIKPKIIPAPVEYEPEPIDDGEEAETEFASSSIGDQFEDLGDLDEPAPLARDDFEGDRRFRQPGRDFGYDAENALEESYEGEAEDEGDERYSEEGGLPSRQAPRRARRNERDTVRILIAAVATLAIVFVALSIYLIYPLLTGRGAPQRPAVAASQSAGPEKAVTRMVGDPKAGAEIPKRALVVSQSYVVFDGQDPTVFVGTSDNPIRFDHDALGGFARIASSPGGDGGKVTIGPGLAAQFAGREIRVVLTVRSARENGATNLRFAYQTGLAISHWQEANLSADYTDVGMTWRAPALRANPAGDFLVIEPGIPGDGTAAEIRSVRIDVLAP